MGKVQRNILSDIFYFFQDSRFSGISEVDENEYCFVSTKNWHYPLQFYLFLIYLNSPDISQSISRPIICLGHRELGMVWRGAVT